MSLKKISSFLEEPILITGVSSSLDLPGWGIEEMSDKLGINIKIRYSNEVAKDFPAKTIIAISASGETEEVVEVLKNNKAKVKIAITGNRNSSLARQATHIIPLICGEYLSDSATKSVVEEYYIVRQLFLERFSKYEPITNKAIDEIEENLKLELPQEIIDVFRRTDRVVVIGQRGFSEEVETKLQEIARIQSEAVAGPLIFYSSIEVLNQGDVILVVDPQKMENYESALKKAARSRDIFYVDKLGIKGDGPYKTIIRYAGLLKMIIDIGKSRDVDIDRPEILARTMRGYKLPLFSQTKKVVVIGGGSGIPSLIRSFRKLGHNITGITSMVDSGGSAGKLRREYKVLPPGDIRRIIAALSDRLQGTEMMNYRFKGGSLDSHTLGNIIIAALEKIEGFKDGTEDLERMLRVKGKALPATLEDCQVYAKLENGQILKGEDEIDIPLRNPFLRIKQVWLEPKAKLALDAKKAIEEADIIIIGPGDLYSTLMPSLLMDGMPAAIKKSKAKKFYICNAMTKLGETVGYSVSDFYGEIEKYLGKDILDYVIYNQRVPKKERISEYQKNSPFVFDYVKFDRKKLSKSKKPEVVGADLLSSPTGPIIHDTDILVKIILSLL